MKIPALTSILLFISLYSCTTKPINTQPATEPAIVESTPIKGVWVTNVASDALDSRENIKKTVQICKQSGMTDIYVVTWNRARTLYRSKIMENMFGIPIMERFGDRDPLQEIIEEGHQAGLKVHAWFEFGFASSYKENGGIILQKYPHWKAIDNKGRLVSKNGFEWMNAINPEVQNFVKSLILEVVANYDVDGIQGDDRLPAMPSEGGYDQYTVDLYKSEHKGQLPPNDSKDPDWLKWRSDKLTDFLGVLYQEVKSVKPAMTVSMAPSAYPWSKEEYLQDWPTWLKKGFCDYVIPQLYRYDINRYTETLKAQLDSLTDEQKNKFFAGVLLQVNDKNPTPGFLDSMIVANRAAGIKGEVFFFYEGLKKFPTYFTEDYPQK